VEYRLNELGIELVHTGNVHHHGCKTDHLRTGIGIGCDNIETVFVGFLIVEASIRCNLAGVFADAEVALAVASEDLVLYYSVLGRIDVSSDYLGVDMEKSVQIKLYD